MTSTVGALVVAALAVLMGVYTAWEWWSERRTNQSGQRQRGRVLTTRHSIYQLPEADIGLRDGATVVVRARKKLTEGLAVEVCHRPGVRRAVLIYPPIGSNLWVREALVTASLLVMALALWFTR